MQTDNYYFLSKTVKLLLLLVAMSFLACNDDNNGTKLLDYGDFTIRVPVEWKRIDVKGIDSFVGRIDIDSATSIGFDLGWYCDTLGEGRHNDYYSIEYGNIYVPDTSVEQDLNDPHRWKYYGKANNAAVERIKRQKVLWETIDGYKSKIVLPKKVGLGITGVHIDSLWKRGDDNDGFSLAGHNLTFKQQQQLLAAIKTLRFKRPK